MVPLDRIREYLKTLDELQVCELLDIAVEDLLDRFADRVVDRHQLLEGELEILDISEAEVYDTEDPYEGDE